MGYASGLMDKRVQILTRVSATESDFGRISGNSYQAGSTIWADVTWTKGVKAMREGALDSYDFVMIRCRYTTELTRECRLKFDGKFYRIESLHDDYKKNTIQITATETEPITIVQPTPAAN